MNAVKHYLWGLGASMVNGGVSSLCCIFGIDGASLTGSAPDAHVLNAHEMLAAFLFACLVHGLIWLKSHPIPEQSPFVDSPTNPTPPKI